jgi:hypothetical protein
MMNHEATPSGPAASGAPEETFFRRLLNELIPGRGDRPDWPLVMLRFLEEEFQRPREVSYGGGRVVIDRFSKDHDAAVSPENSKTRQLFKRCHEESHGCLTIGDDTYWLVSYENPNFDRRSRQCADLLGLSLAGGLVVFECKLKNPYAPLTAVVEGLDYLTCLTAEPNFDRVKEEFGELRNRHVDRVPNNFKEVSLENDNLHEVIVLGSPAYYNSFRPAHSRSRRGNAWSDFAAACELAAMSEVRRGPLLVRFAETDFSTTTAKWITE